MNSVKRKENNSPTEASAKVGIKLYQHFTAKQMDNFLKTFGSSLENEQLVEIINKEEDLVGDFIVINGYKFKRVYGEYQCLQTPTEKHSKTEHIWPKAKNDYYKK